MATYLVTGGAGFIGSHIVENLVRKGEKVRVFDNLSSGKRENLASVKGEVAFIKGDIRNFSALRRAARGVDYVIHQAALRSVPKSVENPVIYNDVNITGTLNVLLAAKENKIKRVVFASSSSVYGDTEVMPQREDQQVRPISPYAATKLAGEIYCTMFTKLYSVSAVSLRYFNVFGPRQSLESQYAVVVPKFIHCVLTDAPVPVHGDGGQSRDFTYVQNVAEANMQACVKEGVDGEVFNVAAGHDYSILDLLKTINSILHKNVPAAFGPPRAGDVRRTCADVRKLNTKLGFVPPVDFPEGLARTVEYFKGYWK
jgi:UDP-glucose 4-epimerase